MIKINLFKFLVILLCGIFFFKDSFAKSLLSDDLLNALSSTYTKNPKIKLERRNLFKIDELMPQALSDFRPKIDGFYNKGKVDTAISGSNFIQDGVRTETSKGITITQPIFNGGSSINKIKEAESKIISQRFLLKKVEQDVLMSAIRVYSKLTSEKSKLKLRKKNAEFLSKNFESVTNQFEIGDLTLTDVSIAKSRLLLAESDLINTESKLKAITEEYKSIIGIEPESPDLFFSFPEFNLDVEDIIKQSKQNNPEIQSILYLIEADKKNLTILKGKKLPSVEIEAQLRKDSGYFKSDSGREIMSAFANIDIPLYQSGIASSKIRESRQNLESNKELLKSSINDLKSRIVDSWSTFETALLKIKAYEEQISANTKFLEGLNQELFLGERTVLEVLDGEQELIESELNLVKANEEYFNSYFMILSHMGNLNAEFLKLPVEIFDDTKNYKRVKFKWIDIIE